MRWILIALVGLALACCGDEDSAVTGELVEGAVWSAEQRFQAIFTQTPEQAVIGNSTVNMRLMDPAGTALPGATVEAEPWMPSMGHGGGGTPVVEDVGGGDYEISDVIYTMGGPWELVVNVSSGGENDVFAVPVDVE